MDQVRITNIGRGERGDGRVGVSVQFEPKDGGVASTMEMTLDAPAELPFAEGDVVGSDVLFRVSLGLPPS